MNLKCPAAVRKYLLTFVLEHVMKPCCYNKWISKLYVGATVHVCKSDFVLFTNYVEKMYQN